MKIGVNAWVWVAPVTTAELEWLIPHVRRLGFDLLEIPLENPEALDCERICRLLVENGLGVSACVAMGPERDLIHPDPAVRENAARYVRESIIAAHRLGARVLAGPLYSATGRVWKQTPAERERDLEILTRQLRELAGIASEHDVVLAIEAINRFETSFCNLTSQSIEIVERVGQPAFQLMVDTFHMNIEETSLGDAIRRAGPRLAHVHTCENDRGAPGSGHIPWGEVAAALREIHYQGACVIESFTSQVESIAKAAAIWRPLAASQDDLAAEGLRFLRALFADEPAG